MEPLQTAEKNEASHRNHPLADREDGSARSGSTISFVNKTMPSSGHYHVTCADGHVINEPDLITAIREAEEHGKPGHWSWICSYGCGQEHLLTDVEEKIIQDAFPGRYTS